MTASVENGRALAPPSQAIPERLPFGPLTTAQAIAVLEQQLAAVWAAVLESHGANWQDGWSLKLEDLRLEKVGPPSGQPGPRQE
jgi:hypothetical protein